MQVDQRERHAGEHDAARLLQSHVEGQRPHDIEQSWKELEREEYGKEMAIKEELLRQEKLEQLAARFDRKAGMRETWLSENQRLVSQVCLFFLGTWSLQ